MKHFTRTARFRPRIEALELRLVPSTIFDRVSVAYPHINEPDISDFEKTTILRQWAYENIDQADVADLLLDSQPGYYHLTLEERLDQFDQDIGGVWCGSAAYFLYGVYQLYGYETGLLDVGIPNIDPTRPSTPTHSMTIVRIDFEGESRVIIQDAYLNFTLVNVEGVPYDILELPSILQDHRDDLIILSEGTFGRDRIKLGPTHLPSSGEDLDSLEELPNGLWKVRTYQSYALMEQNWFPKKDLQQLEADGYPLRMAYLLMYPFYSYGSLGNPYLELVVSYEDPQVGEGPDNGLRIAVGTDVGAIPHVKVFDTEGTLLLSFLAYDDSFLGGVRVATTDVTGNGTQDIITVPGLGGGPHVKVFDGITGNQIFSFMGADPSLTTGFFVAAGPRTDSNDPIIVIAPDAGAAPLVQVFDGRTATALTEFYAYDPQYLGGVRLALGDVDGDGVADVITGAGPGGGPHVRVISGNDGTVLRSFFAFDPTYLGGIYVAGGDVSGNGHAEIVVSAGLGAGAHIKVFGGATNAVLSSFLPNLNQKGAGNGLRVGMLARDNGLELVMGSGPGATAPIRQINVLTLEERDSFFAFQSAYLGGVYVA